MEFRLLVEAPAHSVRPSIVLDGRRWCLTEPLDVGSEGSDIPAYSCISYVWGLGRLKNPFYPNVEMSDHTLPALTAAMRNRDLTAFWIDAFCIPIDKARKRATLESMGYIYARAAQVVVVLSDTSWSAIDGIIRTEVKKTQDFPDTFLRILEQDEWIKSVWTYQEVVNGTNLSITAEGMGSQPIEGTSFLNALGYYLTSFCRANGLNAFDIRERYPYLDAFEDLIADWRVAAWCDRSVFQAMSGMYRREWREQANYFYSLIGTITGEASQRTSNPTIETLAESFMKVCETKGDFSFIFSSAPRDSRPGFEWRPAPTILRPVLSWHTWGDSQHGQRHANGVTLQDMYQLNRSSSLGDEARQEVLRRFWIPPEPLVSQSLLSWIIRRFGFTWNERLTDAAVAKRLLVHLKQIGFTGCEQPLIFMEGFFFPQYPVSTISDIEVWISTVVTWTFGAPGLAVVMEAGRKAYVPGVFLGIRSGEGTGRQLELRD
ncbi:hypothetical protein EW146_g1826 [Bondarzewia mesenterica]|uniref:Heterokaryon incompatibility domain-containing protein n=1 Tax=Bondarzewia mesenterica TaxID=1095465 RepID=A0A4S4M421_9AGAM|nr:hypothetical protein EW146_g1826 [Bondarzewia mesenterica]